MKEILIIIKYPKFSERDEEEKLKAYQKKKPGKEGNAQAGQDSGAGWPKGNKITIKST